MSYLTQQFKYAKGDTWFFAEQTKHNHDRSNEFTKAALAWLVSNASWPREEIETGHFASNQSSHPDGKQLKWDGKKWNKV